LQNLPLLHQFIDKETGLVHSTMRTGVCRAKQKLIDRSLELGKELGKMDWDLTRDAIKCRREDKRARARPVLKICVRYYQLLVYLFWIALNLQHMRGKLEDVPCEPLSILIRTLCNLHN